MTDGGEVTFEQELPSTADKSGEPGLATGALSLRQVLLFGVSTTAAPAALAVNAGAVIYIIGNGAWLAMAIATVLILCIAVPVVAFARRHSVTGSLMSLLGDELGRCGGPSLVQPCLAATSWLS
jgi:hypothetical protein